MRGQPISAFSESLQLLYECSRERHGPLLPVFWPEPPKRFGSHAHQTVAKIHVTPSNMTNLTIPETRSEQELQKYGLISVRVSEHGLDFFRFVDGTDGVDVVGPVARLNQFGLSVTFEELENDDQLVIYRAAAHSPSVAVGHEIQDILSLHLIDIRFAIGLAQQVSRV